MDRGSEEERTQEGRGCSVSQAAPFFFYFTFGYSWRLHSSFHSFLCSHSVTGSLTTAATDLDGFDLLWLENTFML